jgi:hypothetical protein
MKKLILIFLILTSFVSFGQTPGKIIRVPNATTEFGEPVSKSNLIIDSNTGKVYNVLLSLASTLTVATCTTSELKDITDLSGLVPYSGASGDVSVGSHTITAGNFILSSDSTLKRNIKVLPFKNMPINFYSYSFKDDPTNENRYGVIAQEVLRFDPTLTLIEKGKLKVKYFDLIVVMLNNERIKNMELEKRIEKLEKLIR